MRPIEYSFLQCRLARVVDTSVTHFVEIFLAESVGFTHHRSVGECLGSRWDHRQSHADGQTLTRQVRQTMDDAESHTCIAEVHVNEEHSPLVFGSSIFVFPCSRAAPPLQSARDQNSVQYIIANNAKQIDVYQPN